MRRSTERMLTTHVGSLARPHALLETMREKEHGRPYDTERYAEQVREAVIDVVHRQAETGLDVLTDGEQGKVTFATYVNERLGGFDTKAGESLMPASWRVEAEAFPEYYEAYFGKYKDTVTPMRVMVCDGPVRYEGHDAVRTDIANLKKALAEVNVVEGFLPATSPKGFGRNEYYSSEEDYLHAVAEALREEYLAIADSGLLLQIDDPWLIEILSDPNLPPEDRRRQAEQHIEALNNALRGIPEEKIRLHTCYGLNHGPRIHDLPMRDVAPLMLKVNAGAYSFEVANPRHAHEWRIWQDIKLPEGKVLIPGFLSHSISFVEHPELIADGIVTYADVVGRENVIAGADCGYSSRATFSPEVDPRIVWEKFRALSEGAALATKRLWP
jgi:5-methyltetrahydropteroyltriglutamate--homocysteine methyltransferase